MRTIDWMRMGALALSLLAAPALAVDGVREINHTCATTTGGCFTGDTMGYPVTITGTGSYRLTSNLTLANANTDGIVVSIADVSIDLNGFAVMGITDCTGGPTTCTDTGTGRGIASSNPFVRNLSVRNGTVAKMGAIGIFAGQHSQVQDVRVISNGSHGIFAHVGATVLRCTVARNGDGGILTSGDAVVADNNVMLTGGTEPGIDAPEGVVRGNTVYGSATDGIRGLLTSIVGNTLTSNEGNSISAADSTISGNMISALGSASGITATGGSRISENTIRMLSGGPAISAAGDSAWADNVITHSGPPPWVVGSGQDLGGNICNGAPCP